MQVIWLPPQPFESPGRFFDMIHPNITLSVDGTDSHDLFLNAFRRDGYNGDSPGIEYLCYRVVNFKITRITIVSNIYLTMAKQTKNESYLFKAVEEEDAKRLANDAIIKFNTGQRLFGVMTTRQALLKVRKIDKSFSRKDFEKSIIDYNYSYKAKEHLFAYGAKEYISKCVVSAIIDCIELSNFTHNER